MADLNRYALIDHTGIKSIPINSLPPEAWLPLNGEGADTEIGDYISTVAFLYRCIDVRANAVSTVPWRVMRGESEVWTSEANDDPVGLQYEWMFTLPELLPRIEEALCVTSEAFVHLERNNSRLLKLRWLTPSSMKPLWFADGLHGFKRTMGGVSQSYTLPIEEVVYIWLQGMHETTPKTSPVSAAMNAAGVLHNADEFAKQFFARGAIKATILAVPEGTQRGQKEELESWFRRAMTGMSKAWATKAINADAITVIPIGEGLESLSNNSLTASMREDIATAMGVPHSLVLSNAANFATAEVDEMGFYTRTIVPECRRIERALNEQLFNPLGLSFMYTPHDMSIYQEDEEQRSASLLNLVQAGMPLHVGLGVLGFNIPEDEDPQSWVVVPEPEQDTVDIEQQVAELERFKRWAKKRISAKSFDTSAFVSEILTEHDKADAVAELLEDAASDDAPFPVPEWTDYP